MGYIQWNTNLGSGTTQDTALIHCVDGQDPQIHKLWCLGLENITQEVHPAALVEVVAGTMGEFTTSYLVENGHIIPIIRQLFIHTVSIF